MRVAVNYHKKSFKSRDIRYRVAAGASRGKCRDKSPAPFGYTIQDAGGSDLSRPENQKLPALFEENDGDSFEEDVGVKDKGAFLYVEVIVFELVLGLEVIKGTNLGKACNTRFDGKANTLQGLVPSDEVRPFGSRADQAHIAHQDVEQLRKLIEASSPEHFAERSDPPVIPGSPDGAGIFLGIVDHRPEFVEDEDSAVFTDPALFEKNGAGRSDFYEDSSKEHYGGGEDQHKKRTGNIKAPNQGIGNGRGFVRLDKKRLDGRDNNIGLLFNNNGRIIFEGG